MRVRLRGMLDSVRTGLWAVPTACVAVAAAAAFAMVHLDRVVQRRGGPSFGTGPDGARQVLSAITTSMITFTGLVFSITIVVLQLTSSQFSPRVLRSFLRDRLTQFGLGTFIATFVYAVLVLRTVNGTEDAHFVPSLSTALGVAIMLASIGCFVAYIHHIATAIQVSYILTAIGDETRKTIASQMPVEATAVPVVPALGEPRLVVPATGPGVLALVDVQALVRLAQDANVLVRATLPFGAFVPEGGPLAEVHGAGLVDEGALRAAFHLARERTMQCDVAFGFRQLADIATRALSPGVNDPTTAVQALDQMHDLLRRLATRVLPSGVQLDEAGAARVVLPLPTFEDLLGLALEEVTFYGAESPQVRGRIDALLADLLQAALPAHQPALRQRIAVMGSPHQQQ